MEYADSKIRKLTTGQDYNNSMNYLVGQKVIGGRGVIKYIIPKDGGYDIMVDNGQSEVYCWKHINKNMPATVEYNTDL